MDDESVFIQRWFTPLRIQWKVDDFPSSQRVIRDTLKQAFKLDTKKLDKWMRETTIGGRQMKAFLDERGHLILFSNTDEEELGSREKEMLRHVHHVKLPRISTREHKMPILRDYLLGIRVCVGTPQKEKKKKNYPFQGIARIGGRDMKAFEDEEGKLILRSKSDEKKLEAKAKERLEAVRRITLPGAIIEEHRTPKKETVKKYPFPTHQHGLQLSHVPAAMCDICKRPCQIQFRCVRCDYDVCVTCYQSTLTATIHDFLMASVPTEEKEEPSYRLPRTKEELHQLLEELWAERCQGLTMCVLCDKCGGAYRAHCLCAKRRFIKSIKKQVREHIEKGRSGNIQFH